MLTRTNFRDLPGLLSRAHRTISIVRDPASGGLHIKTTGAQPSVVGAMTADDDSGVAELLLTFKAGQDRADLLQKLAALFYELEMAADSPDSQSGTQTPARLQ